VPVSDSGWPRAGQAHDAVCCGHVARATADQSEYWHRQRDVERGSRVMSAEEIPRSGRGHATRRLRPMRLLSGEPQGPQEEARPPAKPPMPARTSEVISPATSTYARVHQRRHPAPSSPSSATAATEPVASGSEGSHDHAVPMCGADGVLLPHLGHPAFELQFRGPLV
jgi:hypothetical protein